MTESSPLVHRLRVERQRLVSRAGAVQPLIGLASMLLIVAVLSLLLADEPLMRQLAGVLAAGR